MQPQDDPNNDTQYQWDIRFQDEAAQSVDMIMVNPPYWPETHPVLGDLMWVDAPLFSQGQWYSPLRPPYTYTLPEDPNGLFPPNVGENLDRATAAGYGGNIPQEGVGPSNGDLRVSPRYGIDPEGHIHLTTNISMTWPRTSNIIERSPTQMSSDSSSLKNALGLATHDRPPESPEDYYQHQHGSIEPSGMDVPHESKPEKDKYRQRERRRKEEECWKALRDIFGEDVTRYDLLRKAGAPLGIIVPPKKLSASKKRATARLDPFTKAERKRKNKNKSGKEETERMRKAISEIIAKHLGMQRSNRHAILTRLVEEVRLIKEPKEDESRAQVAIM